MERMKGIGYPGSVGKFRPEQIAQMSTWDGVPDAQATQAAYTSITVLPKNQSTETRINPLDPGDPETGYTYDHNNTDWGTVTRATLSR